MAGIPGVNVALPAKATQTVAAGLVRGTSAVATSLVTSGFFIAAVTAAYVLIRKAITGWRKSHLLNQVGQSSADGLAIGYAQRLYTAMISGYGWWNDYIGDGTDEDAIFQVGREMHANKVAFSLVSAKYKVLYNRDLLEDLSLELDTDELAKYQRALQSGLSGLGAAWEPAPDHLLYTVAPTVVYDEQLRPVGPIPANMALGEHSATMVAPDGRTWHGYPYQDVTRFVPAEAVDRQLV
jgi:hypothetical protein